MPQSKDSATACLTFVRSPRRERGRGSRLLRCKEVIEQFRGLSLQYLSYLDLRLLLGPTGLDIHREMPRFLSYEIRAIFLSFAECICRPDASSVRSGNPCEQFADRIHRISFEIVQTLFSWALQNCFQEIIPRGFFADGISCFNQMEDLVPERQAVKPTFFEEAT